MKLNKQQETEIMLVYNSYWDNYIKGDVEAMQLLLDSDYTQVGSAEGEVFFNKKDAVQFVYDTIDQIAGKLQMRNRKTKLEQQDNFILIHEHCDLYALSDEEWIFYSKFRASTLMQEKKDGWKIIHQHSSFPDTKADEGQNIAIDKIAEENIQLREAVKRRTVELEHKNRELKIEAALERVRSRTLMMKESKELNEAVAVFFQQFQTLNLLPTEARTYFCHINPITAIAEVWMTHTDGTVMQTSHHTPLRNSPSMLNYFEAWQRKEPILVRSYSGEALKEYLQFVSSLPHAKADKDYQKLFSSPPEKIVMTDANFMQGNIGIMTFQPLSQEASDILIRFARVFELTYTRFLDLQKAEAQVREANIEAALEKVRSRSLAMHKSDELKDVVAVLFQEFQELEFGIDKGAAVVMTFQSDSKDHTQWITDATQTYAIPFFIPFTNHSIARDQINARKKGLAFYSKLYDQKKKNEYFKHLFQHTEYKNIPKAVQELILSSKSFGISIAFEKYSAISIPSTVGKLVSGDEINILKRFAKVFEQSYTRFLDLQKAEAQAREAQIEAALERVRSRSMAMHKSEELHSVVNTLYGELQSLHVNFHVAAIQLIPDDSKDLHMWLSTADGLYDNIIHWPYTDLPVFHEIYRCRITGEMLDYTMSEAATREFFEEYFKLEVVPKERKTALQNVRIIDVIGAYQKLTGIFLNRYTEGSYSQYEKDIVKRFSQVFEQTYTRFLDLQKAEAQAREAQIEASLERVRAKAMAMHSSNDIETATAVVFNELTRLDIVMERCGIVILNETQVGELWSTPLSPKNKEVVKVITGQLDFKIHPMGQQFYQDWEEKKDFSSYQLVGDEVRNYYDILEKHPDYQFPKIASYPDQQFGNIFFFRQGGIFAFTNHELSTKAKNILQRFAKVFEQTYTRFLDIQRAEAQTREAQIEAALERVRAKAMAMHSSKDISDATAVVFNELSKLGVEMERCGILNLNETPVMEVWSTPLSPKNKQVIDVIYGNLDTSIHPLLQGIYKTWTEKKDFYTYELEGEEVKKYYDLLEKAPEYRFPKIARYKKRQVIHVFYFNEGGLFVYTKNKMSDETKQIFQRFTRVFSLTYRRYLDIVKAEAQVREAQIESSLERVRAKAMAMHSSKDIETATAVVFNELTRLGIEMERCGIALINESPIFEVWSTPLSPKNKEVVNVVTGYVDSRNHPMNHQVHQNWQEKKDYSYYKLVGDEVRKYYDKLEKQPGYQFPKIARYPDHQISYCFFFNQGGIFVFANDELNAEEKIIFKRFAKVFEQTYTRFLDLQKAEAQAREAQIEAALERVRAKAMAMHNSEDFNATIGAFYRELEQFSITPRRCGVGLLHKNRIAELSTMNTMEHGNSLEIIGKLKMEGHWVLDGVFDNWCLQKEYHPVLRGNEIKEYNQLLRPQVAFPEYPNNLVQFGYFFFFPEGGVYAWTEKEMKEDELKIYRRFTNVLSLTYKRYKDLKDAEANAREAVRRSSLDRVRAEIASMRSVDDLQRITPIIWHELTVLGVPFVRCGVFIINEATAHVQVFLSSPDGKSLAALDLPFDSSELTSNTVNHWRKGINFKAHWNKEEFMSWMQTMIQQGQVQNQETYQGAAQPPESLHLHFVPFKQGMLYAGNTSPLEKDALELVKALAESFSIAYARYEDFKQLEEAKNQIEKTFTELKATQSQLIQSEKMASLGELTAGIAHEIQNPLNFVNNFSEISNELVDEMKEELEDSSRQYAAGSRQLGEEKLKLAEEIAGDIKQNLEKINHHGKRAADIVKGMLQHSRTSSGQKEPTDINALADEYLRLAYHGLRAKDKSLPDGQAGFNADFKTDFDPDLPKINVIPQDIGRVLLNLINNAFYAVSERAKLLTPPPPEGGSKNFQTEYRPTVTISTASFIPPSGGPRGVRIIVKDNGDGIPPHIIDKIFQPFFTTKPTGQGTGLGLSLSYDIVKAHGGELKVGTKEGEGSEFIIKLNL